MRLAHQTAVGEMTATCGQREKTQRIAACFSQVFVMDIYDNWGGVNIIWGNQVPRSSMIHVFFYRVTPQQFVRERFLKQVHAGG